MQVVRVKVIDIKLEFFLINSKTFNMSEIDFCCRHEKIISKMVYGQRGDDPFLQYN